LQIVASLTAERDGDIRKAALNALATGYKILGMIYPAEIHLHNTYKKLGLLSFLFKYLNYMTHSFVSVSMDEVTIFHLKILVAKIWFNFDLLFVVADCVLSTVLLCR
jgi:hypothetical protein